MVNITHFYSHYRAYNALRYALKDHIVMVQSCDNLSALTICMAEGKQTYSSSVVNEIIR